MRCDCCSCEVMDEECEECLGWGPEDEIVVRQGRHLCPTCAAVGDIIPEGENKRDSA